ncbi:MAG: xanthine dehydrogenase family protein subunit M, partial [Deltaproteobacteria bacterium]|nr:xanthine dehydrogenase family protein subunit M [Deltaproteobacteria bacterium]
EAVLKGQRLEEAVAAAAGEAAVAGAKPLAKNGYKVPLTKTLVKRALLALA